MRKPVGRCKSLSGVTTDYSNEPEHLITHSVFVNILSNCCNGAGNLYIRRVGGGHWDELLHGPRENLPVNRIDSAPGNVNENLIIVGHQLFKLYQLKPFNLTVLCHLDSFYELPRL